MQEGNDEPSSIIPLWISSMDQKLILGRMGNVQPSLRWSTELYSKRST